MSNPPTAHEQRPGGSDESSDGVRETRTLERIVPSLATPIRKTSFWTAIVLPFLYVPLLATGLSSSAETMTFLVLLGLNLVALYVGHAHRR